MQSQTDVEELIRTESLPTNDWDKYFNRIYVDREIKEKLVNYGLLLEQFQKQGFDEMTLAYHGAVLLYGPPGTGKTTLARGVANKVARVVEGSVKFREIRVEQLFSGTLGDTPKAVGNVFDILVESAEDGTKQILLFDEVESLISNRDTLVGETDPMDVARAVNIALERIDELANYPNIYLISTSNLPSAIDSAFFDRADVHFRIGNPRPQHRAQILRDIFEHLNSTFGCSLPADVESLEELVNLTEGFSGRRIRKTVLESIVGDRTTIADPSQFTLGQVEQTVNSTRTRLLHDDAENLIETQLYESETDTESDEINAEGDSSTELALPTKQGDRYQTNKRGTDTPRSNITPEKAGEPSVNRGDTDDSKAPIERNLPVDEAVSGKTKRALNRAATFLSELLEEAGHERYDFIRTLLRNEDVESTLYPIIMGQGLEGIHVDIGGRTILLAADYGMGNDSAIPQPLDDVRENLPSKGKITVTFLVRPNQSGVSKLEAMHSKVDSVELAVERTQSSGGN